MVEYGIELDGVWLPLAMLRRLDEHGPWSAPFTEATYDQAEVLVAHGLTKHHNAGLCPPGHPHPQPGRFAGATATVSMLAEPTSTQREAFQLIGAPIPLTLR